MKLRHTLMVIRPSYKAMAAAVFSLSALNAGVRAAATDISNTPLATTSDITAKPNVMFILDDSGSMSSQHMPDDMSDTSAYGYRSIHCNGVAYDPTYNYSEHRPLNADGTPYPAASFTAAPNDGFQVSVSSAKNLVSPIAMGLGDQTFKVSNASGSSFSKDTLVGIVNTSDDTQWMVGTVKSWSNPTLVVTITGMGGNRDASATWKVGLQNVTDLSNSYYYRYTGSKPDLAWKYTENGLDKNSDGGFANECLARSNSSVFTKVTLTSSSAEAQRYADWYAYYRSRLLMMRTVAGRAFSPIDEKYRVGFTTISSTTAAPSSKFLAVGPFSGDQKKAFYTDLYRADTVSSTPLRGSLSKVGRYFANKAPDQTSDPMEYACQRNYTILSTDGYWNTGDETATYGPLKLDGVTKVGQQDGAGQEDKPYWDGEKATVTVTTPYTVSKTQTSTYDRTTITITSSTPTYTSNSCGFFQTQWKTTANLTKRTLVETIQQNQTVTGTYSNVVTKVNGVATSDVTGSVAWDSPVNNGAATTTTKSDATTGPTSTTVTGTCGAGKPSLPTSSTSNGTTSTTNVVVGNAVAGSAVTSQPSYSGGSVDSLADVAEYYYATDLRTADLDNCTGALGSDVCNNEVPINGLDKSEAQHMTTFTLGLGVSGVLPYNKDYLNASLREGSYYDIKRADGTLTWPSSGTGSKEVVHVDDLWHAAVNGRGQYWSAADPSAVGEAIGSALSNVQRTVGASSSAATSSLKPVKGNSNQVFVAKYTTKAWTGELVSYSLDGTTGEINTGTAVWSAAAEMSKLSPSGRNIYYAQPGTLNRRTFTYTNLSADGLGANFTNFCSKPVTADQCPTLVDSAPLAQANSGTNLVNYLRGDDSLSSYAYTVSSVAKTATVYRPRESMLGDIINASPVYMSKPPFQYADTGYADFVTAKAHRSPVVFAAANDGMLHAFAAESITNGASAGTELWSFIPTAVMPDLYRLADTGYDAKHHFYVDGTPTVGDIKVGDTWKTILVGGLNAGGKSYYALDVTDPLDPKILWEFTDANMGLSYGNPIITKRANGTWVVVFTSGYNNTSGDGNGHLYVLNANTGVPVSDYPNGIATMVSATTPAGTASNPSGLGKLNAWIEDSSDNTSTRFYGGDLLGNLWRFDIDQLVAPKGKAMLLATFQVNDSTPQPITTRPETAVVTYNNVDYPVILVGTGQYLGLSDIADKSTQSIYAVKDALATTGLGNVRQRTDVVAQTLSDTTSTTRRASTTNVNWANQSGWRIDLPSGGERVAVDMQLQYTTLAVLSAIPGSSVCSPSGGSAWLYNLDIAKGASPSNAPDGSTGTKLGTFLGVGLTWVELTNGKSLLIIPGSNAKITTASPPTAASTGPGSVSRTSWRELVN